jgi:hypothetical protein
MDDRRRTARSPAGPLHRTAAVVHGALAAGTTLFALLALIVVRAGAVQSMPLPEARTLLVVWLALLVLASALAVRMWNARADALGRGARPPAAPESMLSVLLPLWVVIAAPAVFGVIVYLLTGTPLLLVISLVYLWLGYRVTRPRRHWFGDTDAGTDAGAARPA